MYISFRVSGLGKRNGMDYMENAENRRIETGNDAVFVHSIADAAGLAANTNSDMIGGSVVSPNKAAPRRFMFTHRPAGGHSDHLLMASPSHRR